MEVDRAIVGFHGGELLFAVTLRTRSARPCGLASLILALKRPFGQFLHDLRHICRGGVFVEERVIPRGNALVAVMRVVFRDEQARTVGEDVARDVSGVLPVLGVEFGPVEGGDRVARLRGVCGGFGHFHTHGTVLKGCAQGVGLRDEGSTGGETAAGTHFVSPSLRASGMDGMAQARCAE